MPRGRLSMRKIREVLRLKHIHEASERSIATSCSVGRTTVPNIELTRCSFRFTLTAELNKEVRI